MSARRLFLLSVSALCGCSPQNALQQNPEFSAAMKDPVLSAALTNSPDFQMAARDPEFWNAMRDPRFRSQVRIEEDIRAHPLPDDRTVDRLEERLSKHPCIGSLDRWSRRYSFALDHEQGRVHGEVIWFHLREAGAFEFLADRRIVRPRDDIAPDDRPYLYAHGSYDIRANRATVESCGPNLAE